MADIGGAIDMKDAYYFSHDCNARHDPKISAMRGVYGSEGYGWYWMLIEMMREANEYKLDMQSKYAFSAYAMQMHSNSETIKEFVHDCIHEFELFESDGMAFWSQSLIRRMDKREEVSAKRSAAAKARWNKKNSTENNENNANDMQMHSEEDANGMQGKESKVKESKSKVKESESKVSSKNTTTEDDFKKIEKIYSELHGCFGLKPKEWPLVRNLIDKGIEADLIIEVMKEKYAKKISEGGSVNSFSFYTNAINERFEQIKETPGAYDWIDDL